MKIVPENYILKELAFVLYNFFSPTAFDQVFIQNLMQFLIIFFLNCLKSWYFFIKKFLY